MTKRKTKSTITVKDIAYQMSLKLKKKDLQKLKRLKKSWNIERKNKIPKIKLKVASR